MPTRSDLYTAFNTLNTPPEKSKSKNKNVKKSSILTVGARALSKHGHRGKEGFWGDVSGKEIVKNQRAELKVDLVSKSNKQIFLCFVIN